MKSLASFEGSPSSSPAEYDTAEAIAETESDQASNRRQHEQLITDQCRRAYDLSMRFANFSDYQTRRGNKALTHSYRSGWATLVTNEDLMTTIQIQIERVHDINRSTGLEIADPPRKVIFNNRLKDLLRNDWPTSSQLLACFEAQTPQIDLVYNSTRSPATPPSSAWEEIEEILNQLETFGVDNFGDTSGLNLTVDRADP